MEPKHELVQVGKGVQNRIQPSREWSLNIQAGPECVIVMAQTLMIVSAKEVMAMTLTGEGLETSSLYANAKNCIQLGADTLRRTGQRMQTVRYLANEMGQRGGTVDKMTKYLDPHQSPARDRLLKRYLDRGRDTVGESVREISDIRDDFGRWQELTRNLLGALNAEATNNLQREQETKTALEMKEMEKVQSERQLEREQKLEAEFSSRFSGALKVYENAVNNLPTTLAGAGAAVGALAAAGASAPVALAGFVALGVQYSVIDSSRQAKADRIDRLERETAKLKGTLAELTTHSQSLSHLTNIVRRSINYLTDLQQKINMFMEYLMNLQTLMDIGKKAGSFTFDVAGERESRLDGEIKKEIFEESMKLKASFMFAAKIAELYDNVSSQYIIPGVDWLEGLRLGEDTEDGGLRVTLDDITRQGRRICSGAEELSQQMDADLDGCMDTLIRETAKSFIEASPGLWSADGSAAKTAGAS